MIIIIFFKYFLSTFALKHLLHIKVADQKIITHENYQKSSGGNL